MPAAAVAGAAVVGGIMSSRAQAKAGVQAANIQAQSADAGIAEQRRQFDALQQLLQPYVNAGNKGLGGYMDLLGQNGADAQRSALSVIEGSPLFSGLVKSGEDALLQNASATGGLRGGNTASALAQFRPQMLNAQVLQQMQQLGGLASMGQNAAAGVGNAGMQVGNNVSQLLQQQGSALAGGALAQGRGQAGMWNSLANGVGTYYGVRGGF